MGLYRQDRESLLLLHRQPPQGGADISGQQLDQHPS